MCAADQDLLATLQTTCGITRMYSVKLQRILEVTKHLHFDRFIFKLRLFYYLPSAFAYLPMWIFPRPPHLIPFRPYVLEHNAQLFVVVTRLAVSRRRIYFTINIKAKGGECPRRSRATGRNRTGGGCRRLPQIAQHHSTSDVNG